MEAFIYILNTLQLVFGEILLFWWIWLPVLFFMVFWGSFVAFNKAQHFASLKWSLLEIKFSGQAGKSLRAMEQVFVALHSASSPPKDLAGKWNAWKDKNFKGKIPNWYSFEIIGVDGQIHFYIRTPEDARNMVEAQIYAHYPDSEITQVPDHIARLPLHLPTADYDVNGAELALTKEDIFPIKTYPEFEEQKPEKDGARVIDPLAPVSEVLGNLIPGEYLGIQVLIRGTGGDWIKQGENAVNKLMGKPEKPPTPNFIQGIFLEIDKLMGAAAPEAKKEEKQFSQLSPGVQETIKSIEKSATKLAFETGIRILYAAPKDRFGKDRVGSILAAFKQFSTFNLNGFKPGFAPDVKKGRNKEEKTIENKGTLYKSFRARVFPHKPFVLNTEELTTIWHFPDIAVKTPTLPRIDAKKGEAPSGIPTV